MIDLILVWVYACVGGLYILGFLIASYSFMSIVQIQSVPRESLITKLPGFSGIIPSKHNAGYAINFNIQFFLSQFYMIILIVSKMILDYFVFRYGRDIVLLIVRFVSTTGIWFEWLAISFITIEC
jgi:hypothetical protein